MTPSQLVKSQMDTDSSISDSIVAAFRDVYFRGKGRLFSSCYSNAGLRRARVFDSVFELDLGDFIQLKIRAVLCEFNEFWLRHAGSCSRDLEQFLKRFGLVELRDESVSNGFDNRFFCLP
jgi:hypothetical protein